MRTRQTQQANVELTSSRMGDPLHSGRPPHEEGWSQGFFNCRGLLGLHDRLGGSVNGAVMRVGVGWRWPAPRSVTSARTPGPSSILVRRSPRLHRGRRRSASLSDSAQCGRVARSAGSAPGVGARASARWRLRELRSCCPAVWADSSPGRRAHPSTRCRSASAGSPAWGGPLRRERRGFLEIKTGLSTVAPRCTKANIS